MNHFAMWRVQLKYFVLQVLVDGIIYTGSHILISVGGKPTVPAIPGAELGTTSDGFFSLKERPSRAVVVGAGYVAVELAQIFAGLGSNTTLAVRGDTVLRHFDTLVSFGRGTIG